MNAHLKWLREHGYGHIPDKLPQVPKEICAEHSDAEKGVCDTFCPYYGECTPVFEELAKALESELGGR